MRIAFIYSGGLRSWEKVQDNHKQNLWTDNCDLFFHTYEEPTAKRHFHFIKIPAEFYPDLPNHKFNTRRRDETSVANVMNQWHNMFIAFCMVPKIFDVYVKVRPDLEFSSKIDFGQYNYENKIYIPEGNDFSGINDRFAFGNYETMRKYYSVYVNHNDLWEGGTIFHPETMVLANLNGLEINRIPITETIIR